MYSKTPIEAVFKRDRIIVISGIAVVSVLAWMYMLYLAWGMRNLDMGMEMSVPHMQSWGVVDFSLMFVMWTVMMVAMMVPSTTPMVLMFASLNRRRGERLDPIAPTGMFLLGYIVAWAWYSALATLGQWGLHSANHIRNFYVRRRLDLRENTIYTGIYYVSIRGVMTNGNHCEIV